MTYLEPHSCEVELEMRFTCKSQQAFYVKTAPKLVSHDLF
jgi:hypothetical protein